MKLNNIFKYLFRFALLQTILTSYIVETEKIKPNIIE